MDDTTDAGTAPRRFRARVGVAALNLITPGLGLLRLGSLRTGVPLLLAPYMLLGIFTFGLGHFPVTGYGSVLLAIALLLTGFATIFIAPIALTWRRSRLRHRLVVWSRWYSLVAVALLVNLPLRPANMVLKRFYKGFYLPSESMAPTLEKNDKIAADMRWRGPLGRGVIVLFNGPDNVRVSRVVGLPGDRVALRHGVPIVNGVAALQRRVGTTTYPDYDGEQPATALTERLPGEAAAHRILDVEPSQFDDMPERLVPSGRFFVLGDNRDRSADSRVPSYLMGVGMVPLSAISGRPLRIYWSRDHGRIGTQFAG